MSPIRFEYHKNYKIDKLIPHEEVNNVRLKDFLDSGTITKTPIIIDRTGLILDGHHRTAQRIIRGLKTIPTVVIDMYDPSVVLQWRKPEYSDTKHHIFMQAIKGYLYPAKTTSFMYKTDVGLVPIKGVLSEIDVSRSSRKRMFKRGLLEKLY